ncbi:MAG: hypothetical protein HXY19_02130 [Thermoanaerobaculaceae bacterium]|nr:hypothetical protein [Thermoanaerobaculaceae bacterium]
MQQRERGSALVLALFMIVILTVLGLGLVLRTKVTMAVAAAERPITTNFYAADSGIHAGYARLTVNNPCAFTFHLQDVRGSAGSVTFPVLISVEEARFLGGQQEIGSNVSGAMGGGGEKMVSQSYRLAAEAFEEATRTRRAVEAEVYFDPKPETILPPCS